MHWVAAMSLAFVTLALPGCASDRSSGNASASPQPSVVRGDAIDVDLTATILRVERSPKETLAEIDAGQRDGVKKDWVMTIGDEQGRFVGNLCIKYVDDHRATGVISLEQGPKAIKVGQKAYAFAGTANVPACGGDGGG